MKRLLCALVVLAAAAILPAAADTPPNIVIIITDDLGYGDLSCYGGIAAQTPNVDRLATEGRRFTRGYAPSATCTPSRYALMTGQYPWRKPAKQTGILDGDAPLAIDFTQPTIGKMLQGRGYTTGLLGKWHLGIGDGTKPVDFNGYVGPGPIEIGFDTAFYIPATTDRMPTAFITDHHIAGLDPQDPIQISYQQRIGDEPMGYEHPELLKYPADKQHSDTIVNGISRIGYMSGGKAARWVDEEITDTLVAKTEAFITANKDRPFFLHLGTQDPHVPRAPHPRFRGKSNAGIRGDAILQIDWLVGKVMASLKANGVADNTLIIFTSDNGPVLFDGYFDGAVEANGDHEPAGGLRGWKYLRYEGGTRVPFIAWWPGHVKVGVSDDMISLLDLFATTAAVVGTTLPPGASPDGLNLKSTLLGTDGGIKRTEIVQHGIGNVLALRSGDWKYLPANADAATGIGRGADPRDQRFTQAILPKPELYNLAEDPSETHNLAAAMPAKVAAMAARLEAIKAGN